MQTNEYSRKNHGHDYSNIRVYARSPEFMSQFATDGTVSSIVELSVTNGTVEPIKIYCPKQQVSFRRRRTIGELKFLALNSLEPVDIDSPNFDGWVYPDGKEYPKNRFENAWRVFNTDPQSTTFRVPTLSTFIKPNPFPYNANSLSVVPAEAIGIPPHTHTINPSKSAIKDIKL